ncbi:MAG: hypothetical protein FK734_17110 [Asgard group archaeon]|nr:hypothetical protein [Asgard group archaeon]
MRLLKTTIFCPSCGTANRDDAEMCTECGSVIPRMTEDSVQKSALDKEPIATDFNITAISDDFGIDVAEIPPPPPDQTPPPPAYQGYAYSAYTPSGNKKICERCGTVLRADASQCPGCGNTYQTPTATNPSYGIPPPPPPPSSSSSQAPTPYSPRPPQNNSSSEPIVKQPPKIAKCAKCGAIVYDYESRCSNCGRILSVPTKQKLPPPPQLPPKPQDVSAPTPPGAARCGKCNAIVYPHQTTCPKCGKVLTPASPIARGQSQRISRCKRCSHIVYPTDTVCPNCGRKLDPVS